VSALTRLRGAWKLVLVGVLVRLSLGLAAGLVPASWATDVTRYFPRGELALADHGALLLFDALAHGSMPYGAGRLSLLLGVVAISVGLVPFGAVVFALHERGGVATLLGRSLSRMGTSLLLSGAALLALALAVVIEVMAFGPLLSAFSRKSLLIPALLIAVALPVPAAFALYGDALRVRGLLADDGFIARFGLTVRCLRGRVGVSLARYLLAATLQLLALAGAGSLAFMAVAQPAGVLVLALVGSCLLLVIAAFARAWLLAHLVAAVEPADQPAPDVEALQGSRDVGYEAARLERPDSSVVRAED
jgi:hypothetical protein